MIDRFLHLIKLPELIKRRVIFLWSLNFLYQVGYILAWVVITALYLQTFGVQNLLWLLLVEAGLLLIGSLISRPFFLRYSVNKFLYVVTALVMVSVLSEYVLQQQPVIFFGIALIAKSLLYPQFRIAFFRKTESFFSPNSARLALPIVETAQTIGTIISSVIVIILLQFLQTHEVLYFWLIPLLGMLFLCAIEDQFVEKIDDLSSFEPNQSQRHFTWSAYQKFRTQPLVMLVLGLVLVKGVLFTMVEYEFTKEVNNHFTEKHRTVTWSWDYLQANLLSSAKSSAEKAIHHSQEVIAHQVNQVNSHHIAHENIAHDLGILSFIFGMIALVMKLFVTRQVLERFGIFKTMFVYFAGLLWWLVMLALGQTDMRFVRGYEHGFLSLFVSPYHLSFYGAATEDRERIRHGLEGVIQPLGQIIGVGLILSLSWWNWSLDWFMVGLCVVIMGFVFRGYRAFGGFTLQNFFTTPNLEEKINILEVMAHPRTDDTPLVLAQRVTQTNQPAILRKKMILTLEKMQHTEVIHAYLSILNDPNEESEIKIHILESLLSFPLLKKYCRDRAFTEVRLLETLENMFWSEQNKHLKKLILMNIFQHIPNDKTVDFMRQALRDGDEEMMAIVLRSCMDFTDPEIISFLEPFLSHTNPRVQSHAIMACWQFGDRTELLSRLESLLNSTTDDQLISALYAIGELGLNRFESRLQHLLPTVTGVVRVHALIALLKLGRRDYLRDFIDVVLGDDESLAIRAFRMRKRLPTDIREKLETAVRLQVSQKIHAIVSQQSGTKNWLQRLSLSQRLELKRWYSIVGGYDSIYVLEQL